MQTKLDEFDREVATDGGLVHESPGFDTRDDGKPIVGEEWVGETIYTSWGYGQTTVNLARIVDVSDSGRTVVAKMAVADRESTHKTSEEVSATDETYGDEFRLYVRESRGDVRFRGSYPYIDGDMDNGTRKGSFSRLETDDSVRQTATNYGH